MAVLLTLALVLPFHAHTHVDLEQWYAEWLAAADTVGRLGELTDMRARHPWYFSPAAAVTPPTPTAAAAPPSAPSSVPASPQEALVRSLVETYFQPADWDAAMRVAQCESGFISTARNPSSSATGIWQFLQSTWAFTAPAIGAPGWPDGALDPEWSTRGAAWLWYNLGPSQWVCW